MAELAPPNFSERLKRYLDDVHRAGSEAGKSFLYDLLNQCKLYATQAGCLVSPVKEVPLLLSMIFAQHKRLMELEERVRT